MDKVSLGENFAGDDIKYKYMYLLYSMYYQKTLFSANKRLFLASRGECLVIKTSVCLFADSHSHDNNKKVEQTINKLTISFLKIFIYVFHFLFC